MFGNVRIRYRLWGGFSCVLLLIAVLGVDTVQTIDSLTGLSGDLYSHSLAVTGAVRDANANILAMHRSMKDVVLARSDTELNAEITAVGDREQRVLAAFGLVSERFSANPALVEETLRAVFDWRAIRAEVIDLARRKQWMDAQAITQGKGADQVARIEGRMAALTAAIQAEATELRDSGEQQRQYALGFTAVLFVTTVLLGFGISHAVARSIDLPLGRITAQITRIAGGETDVEIKDIERDDEIGALARGADIFRAVAHDIRTQSRIRAEVGKLSIRLQEMATLSEFARETTVRVATLLRCGCGAFYGLNEETHVLELEGAFGLTNETNRPKRFALGDGLVGQCALDQVKIVLVDLPTDYLRISSGLGTAAPTTLVLVPVLYRGRLLAVIELGAFHAFTDEDHRFLEELVPVLAINLENLRRMLVMERLVQQSRQRADALRRSEAELRSSEERLRASEEELKVTNEELTEKTRLLEQQADALRAAEEEQRTISERLADQNRQLKDQQGQLELALSENRQRSAELERVSRYKSEFVANMSHELRTPLNSLLILARSLADNVDGTLGLDDVRSARLIYESGRQLLRLINDILDLSRIEAGRMEMVQEVCRLDLLCQALERQFLPIAQDRGVALVIRIDPAAPARMMTDGDRVSQILTNLLGNAFKFTEAGRVALLIGGPGTLPSGLIGASEGEISQAGSRTDGTPAVGDTGAAPSLYLPISVADTGIGIPPEKIRFIFEAFTQAESGTSRRYGGSGLGLAIVRKLAGLLDGRIGVESAPGRGSTFTLYLPLVTEGNGGPEGTVPTGDDVTGSGVTRTLAPSIPPPPPVPEGESFPAPAVASAPMEVVDDDRASLEEGARFILVIEDDPVFGRLVYERSRVRGFSCVVEATGAGGIAFARRLRPMGIVLDLGLPDMDGWVVLDTLKHDPVTRHIPVHFITAVADPHRGRRQGGIGFLTKPVTREQIESALERLAHFDQGRTRRLLIIEDDPTARAAIVELVGNPDTEVSLACSGEQAMAMLEAEPFDCLILDLGLPGMSGFEFLEQAAALGEHVPPVVVYSGRELTLEETRRLREFTDSVVIKGARSPERLLDEVSLFLHSAEHDLADRQRQLLRQAHEREERLIGRKLLVVDDDMRNTFALSRVLRAKGMIVLMAKDGERALAQLEQNPDIELVLMDIMMPGKDGYQTLRELRADPRFVSLPVFALTAKAMPGDRERCFQAGASDYLTKPVDLDKLMAMIRVWLDGTGVSM